MVVRKKIIVFFLLISSSAVNYGCLIREFQKTKKLNLRVKTR